MARACACFALTSLSIFSSESPYHASPLIVEANWWAMRLHSVFMFRPLPCRYYTEPSGLRTNRASRIISCRSHSLRRRDLVHQKFASGALIEKQAYRRVVEVRDSQPRGRCVPIPCYLCQVLRGKQGIPAPRACAWHRPFTILSANASHAVQGRKEEASVANWTEVREMILSEPIRESSPSGGENLWVFTFQLFRSMITDSVRRLWHSRGII